MSNSDLYIVEVLRPKIKEDDLYIIEILERKLDLPHTKRCPYCGGEATFLATLGRYYCFNCKRYA